MKNTPQKTYLALPFAALILATQPHVFALESVEVQKETSTAKPPVELNPAFAPLLYDQLRSREGNVWFSPYSITEAMAMVHEGAKGNTVTEIASAMQFPKGSSEMGSHLHTQREYLMKHLNEGDNSFAIANGLCITGSPPLKSYQEVLRKQYDAEIFPGDLDKINGWVKEKTQGEIDTILDSLENDTACVILNAVYFKGVWREEFNTSLTHKADFHVSAEKSVKVDMMKREGSIQTHQNADLIAVSLPYQNGSCMVLIQPTKRGELSELEEKLNADGMEQIFQELNPTKGRAKPVDLYLPKFKLSSKYSLIKPLSAMGIRDAFVLDKADFSARHSKPVYISDIIHKATLEVDEAGSVAAAATAVVMKTKSAAVEMTPKIRFDQPFLVMIRDQATNSTLFMGRVSDPTLTE